jgi:hypothetical protein
MKARIRGLAITGVLCGLTLALAACGGSSSSSGSGGSGGSSSSAGSSGSTLKPALSGSGENLTDGKKGGTLTAYDHVDFQHLDSGQAYYSIDYEVTTRSRPSRCSRRVRLWCPMAVRPSPCISAMA